MSYFWRAEWLLLVHSSLVYGHLYVVNIFPCCIQFILFVVSSFRLETNPIACTES